LKNEIVSLKIESAAFQQVIAKNTKATAEALKRIELGGLETFQT